MYKLILVDDEPDILKGMVKAIPWDKWGFIVAGQASDGLEALKLIEKDPPDVVLSDIRMPHMDGIGLMESIDKNYPDIKVIILSGYNDFEYLKIAIKNRVVEYLLKPTDLDEFETAFLKIKNLLDMKKKHEEEVEGLKKEVKEGQKLQYGKILNELIQGLAFDGSYHILTNELGLSFDNCIVAILDIQKKKGFAGLTEIEEVSRQRSLVEYCNIRENPYKAYFFESYTHQVTAIIAVPKDEEWVSEVPEYFQELQSEIFNLYEVEISVGISDICKQVSSVSRGYNQAERCIRQKTFLGNISILLYSDLDNCEKTTNNLVQAVKNYVDREYCSNYISLDSAAEHVKKNAAYLSKRFKQETGYNFSDYLTLKRMEKSKELLLDPTLKIYEIAEMTGYADVSNFIKVFRKNCGVSPTEYRNMPQ